MNQKLHPIQLKLLNCLDRLDKPVSAQFLANNLGISSKTARNYLNHLNQVINSDDFKIDSKTGQGYRLIVYNRQNYSAFLQKNSLDASFLNIYSASEERTHFIIRHLLCCHSYVKIEELEDLMYINRTSVKHALNEVKEILAKFQLKIIAKSRYGLKIEGAEHDLRLCINYEYDYCLKTAPAQNEKETYKKTYFFDKQLQSRLEDIILMHQKVSGHFHLSDFGLKTLAQIIQISAIRNKTGNYLFYSDEVKDRFANDTMFYTVHLILNHCSEILDCTFDYEDIVLITICLNGFNVVPHKNSLSSGEYNEYKSISFELVQYLSDLNKFNYLKQDIQLIDEIALHLSSLMIRSNYHLYTSQFENEIKSWYSLMSQKLSMQAFCYLHDNYEITITQGEIKHLAMIIHPVFGRYPMEIRKIKACLVSDVDKNVGKSTARRLMRSFKYYIEQIDIFDLWELKETNLDQYELLFTSYNPEKLDFLPKHLLVFQADIFWDDIIKRNIRYCLTNILMNNYQIQKPFREKWLFKNIAVKKGESVIDIMCRYLERDLICPEKFRKDLTRCQSIMDIEPRNSAAFFTGMESHTESATIAIFILKHPVPCNKKLQKAQVLVYWDRGQIPDEAQYFENAYIPHLIYEVFRSQSIIDELIKNGSYEHIIKQMNEYFQNYLTQGSTYF